MSDIKKLLSKSEEAGKPTEGERELLIESLLHQSTLHNMRGDTALALLFTSAAQEIESLQAENAELKSKLGLCANHLLLALNLDEIEDEEDKASIHAKANDFIATLPTSPKGGWDERY